MSDLYLSNLFQRFWAVAGSVSIRVKVLGIVLGVILLLGFFVTQQMRYVLSDTLQAELVTQGHALTEQYGENIGLLLAEGDRASLRSYLAGLQEHYSTEGHNTLVDYVRVLDSSGAEIIQVAADEHTGGMVLEVPHEIHGTGDTLVWGMALANVQRTVDQVTLQLLAITMVMVAVGFAAAFFLTWIITRPIYDMVAATQAVAAGDFSRHVPRWANDELGDLAQAFNTMTASLAEADQERAERDRLRSQYVSRVISAQEDERKRIARELHDSTGQSLTSLLVGLQNLRQAPEIDEVKCRIDELREVVSGSLDEVRALAWQLRPSVLDDLGLVRALEHYITDYQKRYNVQVDLLAKDLSERLPLEMETVIYRIVQEGLTNIVRHADASTASVIIDRRPTAIRIIVEDNGRGFDVHSELAGKSLGLQGIRERAALFGGYLVIESQPGQGTSLFVELPLAGVVAEQVRP